MQFQNQRRFGRKADGPAHVEVLPAIPQFKQKGVGGVNTVQVLPSCYRRGQHLRQLG